MKPILPSEMVDNPELASILQKLHASSADYAVFTSGTKISETVAPVNLFDSKGKVKSQAVPTGVVDLKYLKEQVLIENKEDFNSIFSTQFRKLVYKDATTESELSAYQEYKSIIENLTNFDKLNFVEQLQDKEKLVEFLIKEISKKNAAESTKDLLQLKTDNTLMYTLDSMIDRTIMESAIVASVKNQIIRQKVPGAQRVQYPVSLIRPNRKLAYYDIKSSADGSIIRKAETIVSFSKGYYPLLNLLSPIDNQPIGELNANGIPVNSYTALTRLNEALKDVQFRNTYASQLSMVAIRIPGQGYNSMENFEVVEFLPEESGEIILVPDEMVIKSGSDYDIDKLFCYDPSINNDGSMLVDRVSTPEDLIIRKKELLSDLKETRELKRQYTEEKKELLDELRNILTTNGFDASSRLGNLYQELKSLKGVSEGELMDAGVTEGDLETLRKKFSGELVPEKQQKSAETIDKIRRIKNVLRTASEKELSSSLADLGEWIGDLVKDEKSLLQDLKNLRNGYTNALLLNISNRLSQPEIFEALITPNTTDTIDKAVKEFGTSSDSNTASLTNLISPNYQLYVFSLNTYKTALGTDAKNNVFHSLLQKTTFYREDKKGVRRYLLESNRTADGYIDFSRVNNVDGTRISRMSGETISAHVDIEKNDGIARIGLNNLITPVVNYVLMAGTRFNDIVNLINKTTVIGEEPRSSILEYSKGKSLEDILKTILEGVPENSLEATLINNSKDEFDTIIRSKFISNVYKQMYAKTTQETAREELLSRKEPLFDVRRLAVFLELEDQTRDLATISLAVDYDTFSPQNFESFSSASLELIPYLEENGEKSAIFNRQGLLDVIGNTVVSSFQVQQDVLDKFVEVFPISANPKITNKILKQYSIAKQTNRRLDYDRYSRVFKNDLLYALFLNNVPQAGMFEQFLDKKNPGNIGSLYTNLKTRLAQRGITAENDIFGLVSINSDINSTFIRTGLKQTELEFSVDIYKEEFEKGFNWSHPSLDPTNASDAELIADMQGFFKAFAYAGILGTQLNKKFDSYLPLIPESIYTFPMSSVIPEFISRNEAALEEDNSKFMNDFTTRFRENHPELYGSKNIPVTLNYYKDYNLSRDNIIDLTTISQSELTLKYSESAQASTNLTPKGTEVKGGIYVNQSALSQEEQLELFNYLKPFLEEQAAKTNKGKSASKMIGLGLRWDYKSNNPGKKSVSIPDVINPLNKTKYGYYTTSINDQPLAPITSRFRELMQKASGVDMTNYDGAIINLYEENTFISSHNDVDESRSAINYPVIGVNLGGTGNFSIESRDGSPKQLDLKSGTAYVFGVNGVNREVFHRTLPKPQDSFLPELTTRLDGKTYEPGSYRVTITMRRVMPLVEGMTTNPLDVVTQITNVPKQLTINFEEENQLFLDESFAKLREINNNLSKNC
jgi:alkylated DNA repair dioxygenase AlkB